MWARGRVVLGKKGLKIRCRSLSIFSENYLAFNGIGFYQPIDGLLHGKQTVIGPLLGFGAKLLGKVTFTFAF